MSMIQTYDNSFEPQRRGRPRRVDVTDLMLAAEEANGQWVSADYNDKDAQSAVRQIKREYLEDHVEVVTNKVGDQRRVFVRRLYPES